MSRIKKIKLALTEEQVRAVIGSLHADKFQAGLLMEQPALREFREVFERQYKVIGETHDEIKRQYDKWRERNEQM